MYHCLLAGAVDVAKKVVRACAPQLAQTRFNVEHLCMAMESTARTRCGDHLDAR